VVVRRAAPMRQLRALAVTRRWRHELGVRRPVRLVTSRERHVPFTLGTLRPVIFTPEEVAKHEDPAVLESVIAHELAHIKRWDDLALVFQLAVSVFYFFDPVAWASARRMREESERACDQLVLSRGDLSPRAYGRSIVAVLKLGLGEPATAPALGSRKRSLRNRLETIMKGRSSSTNRLKSLYPLPAALALGLFLLPMAGNPADQAETDGSDGVVSRAAQQETASGWQLQVSLTNPLPGSTITARFGPMIHPYTKNQAHHNGIDIKAPAGSQIVAPADGIVEVATAEYSGGADFGIVIIVDHGSGVRTLYAHLDSFAVEAGQRVSHGDVLGIQGSTGKSTGPHLHFEVLVNGEHEDPASFVADWR
jgi:murein DD-endopeptidase MepM/ murein hydrolase activator NlpD